MSGLEIIKIEHVKNFSENVGGEIFESGCDSNDLPKPECKLNINITPEVGAGVLDF